MKTKTPGTQEGFDVTEYQTKQEVWRIFDFSPKVCCRQGHCTWARTLRPVCSLDSVDLWVYDSIGQVRQQIM